MRLLLAGLVCFTLGAPLRAAAPPPVEQWIVVVPPDYEKAVAPLVAHRRAQGLRVAVVRVGDVLSFRHLMAGDAKPLRDRVRTLWATHPGRSSVLPRRRATRDRPRTRRPPDCRRSQQRDRRHRPQPGCGLPHQACGPVRRRWTGSRKGQCRRGRNVHRSCLGEDAAGRQGPISPCPIGRYPSSSRSTGAGYAPAGTGRGNPLRPTSCSRRESSWHRPSCTRSSRRHRPGSSAGPRRRCPG